MYLGNNLQAAYSNYQLIDSLTASFNGTTTSFPLRVNGVTPVPFPLNEQNVLISVGGVPQKPDATGAEGFKFSGSNIVFSSAPKTGEAFWGVILAGADYVNVGVNYPDGSASVPSITFGSEKTTGFYRLGSGTIGVTLTGVLEATFSGSGLSLYGGTSGTTTLAAPAVAGNNVLTLPANNGSSYQLLRNGATAGTTEFADKIVSGTAVASTSGTSIDFTGIPAWVKRITVMFNGVSTNGASNLQCQVGSGSITTSGYVGGCSQAGTTGTNVTGTTGLLVSASNAATLTHTGTLQFMLLTGTTWIGVSTTSRSDGYGQLGGTTITLSGTLDRLRIIGSTTGTPTDTFDAGSVNILYE
jgi:hypothetical protein